MILKFKFSSSKTQQYKEQESKYQRAKEKARDQLDRLKNQYSDLVKRQQRKEQNKELDKMVHEHKMKKVNYI